MPYARLESPDGRTTYTSCSDCGALVYSTTTHDRFHAILNAHARAIAVMVNQLPDNVRERAVRGNDNNWSREAFKEVVGDLAERQEPT